MTETIEQLQRSLKMYKGLVEVSALINSITDFNELLPAILDVARRVMGAEASSLFMVDTAGDLRLTVARGPDGSITKPDIVVPKGRGIAGWVYEHNEPLLVADAYADPRFFRDADKQSGFHTRSILCVPLHREDREIGVLQVLNPAGREQFDQQDIEVLNAYGYLAATAIDKLRTLEQQAKQKLVEQELAFAHEIQASFLPQCLPCIPGLDFAAMYRPARNVSGDFYDVIQLGPDEIFFVIGDVAGKGVPAALLMAQALSYLRLVITPDFDPAKALEQWNRRLCQSTIRGMFITTIVGRVIPSKRTVEFASAGHPAPFCLNSHAATDIAMVSSPPVGILETAKFQRNAAQLDPGAWLIFFTDGLVESFDPANNLLGRDGARKFLAAPCPSAQEVVGRLTCGESKFRGNGEPPDDLTIFVLGFR